MTGVAARSIDTARFFKTCNNCGINWPNLTTFLGDPKIHLIGYMPAFENITSGLFLFNHDCRTTLACKVDLFKDLYHGPIFKEKKTGSTSCPRHCQDRDNLESCPEQCGCAFAREIIQILKSWPKSPLAKQ